VLAKCMGEWRSSSSHSWWARPSSFIPGHCI